jgi:hypothetical protein
VPGRGSAGGACRHSCIQRRSKSSSTLALRRHGTDKGVPALGSVSFGHHLAFLAEAATSYAHDDNDGATSAAGRGATESAACLADSYLLQMLPATLGSAGRSSSTTWGGARSRKSNTAPGPPLSDFHIPAVCSVTISLHKFIGLGTPAAVFLCRSHFIV